MFFTILNPLIDNGYYLRLMRLLVTVLFSLISTILWSQRMQGLPFIKYFSSQDYKGGIQNWSITQNNDGLIYVANNFGLLEYDGTRWNRYELPRQTKMRDVSIADDGLIYYASQGDFGFYDPTIINKNSFISLADSLPDEYRNFDETWKVFIDGEELIFCTFNDIFIYSENELQQIISPSSPPENFHFINNTLYVNQLDIGLSYLIDGELRLFDKGDFFKGKAITAMIPLVNNHLLIATEKNGIYTYNGDNYELWNSINNAEFANSLVNSVLRLRNGNMAIGTQNNGVFVTTTSGDILYHLNKSQGLNNRTVLSMYEDRLGNLWLGHNNGLTSVELTVPFTLISEQVGLPGTGYDGHLSDEHLYLGTNNGLYLKSASSGTTSFYQFVENTEGQVYNINSIDNLTLLGHHKGTFLLEDTKTEQISDILGAWTFLKLKDHPQYIIGGTYKGLLLFKKSGSKTLQFVRRIKGFDESSRVMELDDEGNIWMTHGYKGVYKLNLNDQLDSVEVKYYGQESGLPSNILINVWKINSRLIFTTESQVYRFDYATDSFVLDDFFKDYFGPESAVSFLEQDPLGNIYYLAGNEIGVLQKLSNNSYIKKTKIFNRIKGLLNDDLQDLSVLNANNIIYGAKEGFILYTKNNDNPVDIPYNCLITKVNVTSPKDSVISGGFYKSNGVISSIQSTKAPQIPFDNNSLHIEYSAPFFHSSENTVYQFKLEKSDSEWSTWTTKTDKEYTNLREGKYTFKVRAKNIYDQLSEEAAFTFEILPPWYRSNLAYGVYAVVIISSLAIGFLIIDVRFKRQRKLMELKQEKTINRYDQELKSSEERLEQLKSEKLKAQVDSQNKELATSTMHLLNKNSFINSIKHNISTIIKRSKNQEVKKELNKIMTNIDKNISEDNDWEHFAIHFDQVHGDFTNRLKENYPDLTPQEMKLSAYLRMNLSTKEIAHLLNISVRGVEIARYRLRKKMKLERSDNLQEFILKY